MRNIDMATVVTLWYCVTTAKHIVKILPPSDNPVTLVFL